MDQFSKKLTDDEIRLKFIRIPKGKEKLFKKGDFQVGFNEGGFTAYIIPVESKSMGPNMKTYEYQLKFRDPQPPVFVFNETLEFITFDSGETWLIKFS
ncbi:MAG: hypothetical protein GX421_06670 [Caldisericales bacterium]|nr:hypothetical protein [Caldisericales bacterium]